MIRFSSSFLFVRLCYMLNITVASLIVSKLLVLLGLNWHWPLVNIAPSQKPNSQLPFHIPNKNHAHFLGAYCPGQGALGLLETGPPSTRSNFIPPYMRRRATSVSEPAPWDQLPCPSAAEMQIRERRRGGEAGAQACKCRDWVPLQQRETSFSCACS